MTDTSEKSERFSEGRVDIFVCRRPTPKECTSCRSSVKRFALCDFKVGDRTCDRLVCFDCAKEVGPDKHYCPAHARLTSAPSGLPMKPPGKNKR